MATAEIILPILGGIRDTTNPPAISYVGHRPYLLFDGTADELITWTMRMPDDYASGLTIKWQYSMVSATTNKVAIRSQVMAAADGVNIDTLSYATLEASADSTVPGTAGLMKEISFALANLDGLAGGSHLSINLGRENGTAGTNATGDMAVWSISLSYTTT